MSKPNSEKHVAREKKVVTHSNHLMENKYLLKIMRNEFVKKMFIFILPEKLFEPMKKVGTEDYKSFVVVLKGKVETG